MKNAPPQGDGRREGALRTAFLLLAALLVPSTARAFERLEFTWSRSGIGYRVGSAFPDTGRAGSRAIQREILRCGAAAWTEQSRAPFRFVDEGETAIDGFRQDGRNTVSFSPEDGGDAVAATLLTGFAGRAMEFDIVFFGRSGDRTNRWSGPGDPNSGTVDIAGVAAHEFGHALGLGHTPVEDATMFARVVERGVIQRTLERDDRNGVEALYGTGGEPPAGTAVVAVEPAFGPASGGFPAEIRGHNFTWTSDSAVSIGGQRLERSRFEVTTCRRIRILDVPPGTEGPVEVRVESSLGASTLPDGLRYGPPPPELLGIEPAAAPLGGEVEVTVRGARIPEGAEVRIGDRPLVASERLDAGTVVGRAPPAGAPGPVDVTLSTGSGIAVLEDAFRYRAKVLRIGEAPGVPGGDAAVDVTADTDAPLRGLSFALSTDPARLTLDDVTVAGTETEGAEFAQASVDAAGGVTTFGLVMSFTDVSPRIPPGERMRVAVIAGRVAAEASPGDRIPLRLEESAGDPPVDLLFTTLEDARGVRPLAFDGSVPVEAPPAFVRGDVDDDGSLSLADAVGSLEYLFRGSAPPRCTKAADTDDDGSVDLSDPVRILNFLFLGGAPPPDPWPGPGPDPTPDRLPCAIR